MFVKPVCIVVALLAFASFGLAQEKKKELSEQEQKQLQSYSELAIAISSLSRDRELGEQIELAPDQRRKLLVLMEKQRSMFSAVSASGKFSQEKYLEQAKKYSEEAKAVLTEKQAERLVELVKERRKKMPRSSYSSENLAEMRRLSGLMSQLSRLTYDRSLKGELELTAEQRVDIREIQQEYRELTKEMRDKGVSYISPEYKKLVGEMMIKAQEVLTPEQSEYLLRGAKLNQLRIRYGDGFGMLIGLLEDYDLSPEQSQKLQDEIAKARADFYAQVKELSEETLEKVLRKLPSKHRDEAREAVEKHIFKEPRALPTVRTKSPLTSDPFQRN